MIDYKKEANSFLEKNFRFQKKESISNKVQHTSFTVTGKEVNEDERTKIRSFFLDGLINERDFNDLLRITCHVRAIQKQGILLLGEKIFEAREIIRKNSVKKNSFSLWIKMSFKTKSSAYNALSYYSLYTNLSSEELKKLFLELPYKAAYKLSSKNISVEEKELLIPLIVGLSNSESISLIEESVFKMNYNSDRENVVFRSIKNKLISVIENVSELRSQKYLKEVMVLLDSIRSKLNG